MRNEYDAVVLGSGSGGRGVAKRLAPAGMTVAIVEQELVGGECPFWACMPSKALLRPPEVRAEAVNAAGVAEPAIDWPEVAEYRDWMNSGLDDAAKSKGLESMGIDIVRGHGRITGPGQIEVGDRTLQAEHIVVATGTTSAIPPIEGLEDVPYWTNREATTLNEIPESAVVLGGGPVGIELGQVLSRFGARVTLVEGEERLLSREDASVGDQLADLLRKEGMEIRLGTRAARAHQGAGEVTVELESGESVSAEKLLVAVGRTPRLEGIGLETVGIDPGGRAIDVDEHCRAADGVWAVGDVTGIAAFTHVAAYQARIVSAAILGEPRAADYRAIPRVVFCDPEVAAVGLTPAQAGERGLRTVTATAELENMERSITYGREITGHLGVLADADREVLVGAWAVGPLASEWIHALVVAVRAEVPVPVLRDTVMQFPSFSEAIATAVAKLPL